MKIAGIILLSLVAIFALTFLGNSLDLFTLSFFGPKLQAAQTKIFENTPAYTQAKNQDLAKYHHEWVVASDPIEKRAIESLVRQQLSIFPPDQIKDPELQAWFQGILNQ